MVKNTKILPLAFIFNLLEKFELIEANSSLRPVYCLVDWKITSCLQTSWKTLIFGEE